MRRLIPALLLVGLIFAATPAHAGDCLDAADDTTLCYGDNTFHEGSCDGAGFDVGTTGLIAWLPDDSFVFVGGFAGCSGEDGRSDFSHVGTQGHLEGPVRVSWNAGHYEATHADEERPDTCYDMAYVQVTGPLGTGHGVAHETECTPGSFPVLPWGELEPEP